MQNQFDFLKNTPVIDSDHPAIRSYVAHWAVDGLSDIEKARGIYYAVRDRWQYTVTKISFREEDSKASALLCKNSGHCVEKSMLMVAFCRAVGIPARLCLAKVRNHIAAERVEQLFGTDVLVPHGYAELFLEGKWVKATPAFNKGLCEKLGVEALEFDGKEDSLFQAFSTDGTVFMEYLEDYGHFEDLPTDFIIEIMKEHYPTLVERGYPMHRGGVLDIQDVAP